MKRFIVSVLAVAVFFIGLGGIIERVGARFKSDERALEIIKQARVAIGGEDAIKQVRALTLAARATQTFNFDGTSKVEQGDVEINLQLPNQLAKTMRFGNADSAGASEKVVSRDVFIVRKDGDSSSENVDGAKKKVFIIKKGDGDADKEVIEQVTTNADSAVRKIIADKDLRVPPGGDGGFRQNELFRLTFALLLSAPEGADASYTYAGEGDVDGNACDIIQATAAGDAAKIKLFIGKSSHLPVMMSYQALKPFMIKFNKDDAAANGETKDSKIIVRRAETGAMETAEFQVKFSDYRSVNGLQLPFKWTQTANGQADQTLDVSNYEINPANIADKFQKSPTRIMIKKQQ